MKQFPTAADYFTPTIWIGRVFGQLPLIWHVEMGRWYVPSWYHPQFLYFLFLIMLRVFLYACSAYSNAADQVYTNTSSMQTSSAGEIIFISLRHLLAPYSLLFGLKSLHEALETLQHIDFILGTKRDYAAKPRKVMLSLFSITAVTVSLKLYFGRDNPSWIEERLQVPVLGHLAYLLDCLDTLTEMNVIVQFALATIVLQQRLATLRLYLKQLCARRLSFCTALNKITETDPSISKWRPTKQLRYSYALLCQVATRISDSFGLPLLFLILGNTLILMFSVYAILRPLFSQSIQNLPSSIIHYVSTVTTHAAIVLIILFYFADTSNEEVLKLKIDLQTLACSETLQNPTLAKEIYQFHQVVCADPPERVSAAGFYSVGKNLVTDIIGVILTYFFILIQFDKPAETALTQPTATAIAQTTSV